MEYRIAANKLMTTLEAWDELIPGRGKIHLIACGGTALTLLGYKESTKDVDFVVPQQKEFERLVQFLTDAGYKRVKDFGWCRPGELIIFDLFAGNTVYTTGLLDSPLEAGRNRKIREWSKIYLGVLNTQDLIISKMFRGTEVDIQDCLTLMKNEMTDLKQLKTRYEETASYQLNPEKMMKNFDLLMKRREDAGHEGRR